MKASEGNEEAQKAFKRLGISQSDVIAGQKDLWPLLLKTMDAFHGNSSAVQKAAEAREVFSKGGTQMLNFLNKGSKGLEELSKEAQHLGLILNDKDIWDAREFKLSMKILKEETEALDVQMGKSTIGIKTKWTALKIALMEGFRAPGGAAGGGNVIADYFNSVAIAYRATMKQIEDLKKASHTDTDTPPIVDDKKIAVARENWYGISAIVESLKGKIAGTGDEQDRLNQEVAHYNFEIDKASEELAKMRAEGKITAEASSRELALLKQVPGILANLAELTREKIIEAGVIAQEEREAQIAKAADELREAHEALVDRLAAYDSQDYEHQRAKFAREMDQLREQMAKKAVLTDAEYKLLDSINRAGLNQIARTQTEAYVKDLEALQQYLGRLYLETATTNQKLKFQYEVDLQEYSQAAEAKKLVDANGEAERAAIHAHFDAIRTQLTDKYKSDLQGLLNSQGWKGVFGSTFANLIRGNEQLLKEWSTSANQSLLLVRVSFEGLKEIGQQAFEELSKGMGQNIAQAIVYSTSVAKAMRAALAATLESVAAQCLALAIYAAGLGFLDLALGNYAGAGEAFTAAAIFGSVGVATAFAGRAIAPKDAGAGASAGAGAGSGSAAGSAATAGAGSGSGQTQPSVTVVVQGHVIGPSGASELCDIINQAVYGNDATLYASHSASGVALG